MSFATELGRVLKQAAINGGSYPTSQNTVSSVSAPPGYTQPSTPAAATRPRRKPHNTAMSAATSQPTPKTGQPATPQPRTVLQDATPAQVSAQQRGERQALAQRFAPMLFESNPQGGQRLRRGAGYAISHDPSGGMSRGVALAPAESRANDLNYADQARSLARQPQQGMSDYAWRTAPHRQPSQVDPARQQVRNRTTAFGGQAMRDWRRPVSMSSEEMAQARESGSEFTPGPAARWQESQTPRERLWRNVGNINLARVNPSWMQRLWPAQVEGPAAYRQSYPGVSTTPQQAPSGLRRFVQPAVSWWNRNFRDQQPVQFAGT